MSLVLFFLRLNFPFTVTCSVDEHAILRVDGVTAVLGPNGATQSRKMFEKNRKALRNTGCRIFNQHKSERLQILAAHHVGLDPLQPADRAQSGETAAKHTLSTTFTDNSAPNHNTTVIFTGPMSLNNIYTTSSICSSITANDRRLNRDVAG